MPHQQQITEADDRRQQIVKVVGDTARQLADGLHFLGLGELQLQIFLFRCIDQIKNDNLFVIGVILKPGDIKLAVFLPSPLKPTSAKELA